MSRGLDTRDQSGARTKEIEEGVILNSGLNKQVFSLEQDWCHLNICY
jgi:hypothetical protein